MYYLFLIHLALMLLVILSLFEKKPLGLNFLNIYQLLLLVIVTAFSRFDLLEFDGLTSVYLIGALIAPMLSKTLKNEDDFYLYLSLSYIFTLKVFEASLFASFFSLSFFLFLTAVKRKSLLNCISSFSIILYSIFFNVGVSGQDESLLTIGLIGVAMGIFFYNLFYKKYRFMNILILSMGTFLLNDTTPLLSNSLMILAFLSLVLFRMEKEDEVAALVSSLCLALFFKPEPVIYLTTFLTIALSSEMLKTIYRDLLKINFKKGSLEVDYAVLSFIFFGILLVSGLSFTPFSFFFETKSEGNAWFFLSLYLLWIIRLIISQDRGQEDEPRVKLANYIMFSLLAVVSLSGLVTVKSFFWVGAFPITCLLLAVANKKYPGFFKTVQTLEFRLQCHLVNNANEKRISRKTEKKPKAHLIKASILPEANLSFPVTVGFVFFIWFIVAIGMFKK